MTSTTATQLFTQATASHPQHRALIYQGRQYDYSGLSHMVSSVARILQRSGVGPGSRLAIFPQPLLTLLTVLAAPQIGCRVLPLNPNLPRNIVQGLIDSTSATHLIAEKEALSLVENLHGILPNELLHNLEFHQATVDNPTPLSMDEAHLYIATSGSDAQPKVVQLSSSNIIASIRASRRRLQTDNSDIWLCCLPLYHIGGLSIPFRCVEAAATLLLHDSFDAQQVCDDLHRYAVTHISLVPAMLAKILDHASAYTPPVSLRVALIGGASLSLQLYERAVAAGWPLAPTYGMTENCSQIATLFPPPAHWQPGLVGKPLDHTEITIDVDSGAIRIRGDGVMTAYIQAQGQYVPHPAGAWFETGDLGAIDGDGNLIVYGRGDETLISGGENIHPAQIETQLLKHPDIIEVAVIGAADPVWGDIVVAVYAGSLTGKQLQEWCKQHLHGAWRPR
ncbi:MAG: class I adenylate-forming enzyme family protein, partial [Pseudomonadota bacterium]|nr:class I adenylate-forming enzyme family protein [Pseudomonadota bacterium]